MKKKAVVGLVLAVLSLSSLAADEVTFTDAELRAIFAHGPWPMPIKTDPSNRVSGKREAIELGEVVKHYGERLKLAAAEQSDLAVLLESLSTFNNPWRPEDLGVCR
jgi:hypothetical protein